MKAFTVASLMVCDEPVYDVVEKVKIHEFPRKATYVKSFKVSLVSHFVMEFSPINQDLVTAVEQLFSEGYSSNALSSLMTRYVLNDSWEEQAQDLTGKRYRASFQKPRKKR